MPKKGTEFKAFPKSFWWQKLFFIEHTQTSTRTWDTLSPHDSWFPGSVKSHWNLETKQTLYENYENYDPYKSHPGTKGLIFHWGRLNISGHIATLFPGQTFLSKTPRGSLWLHSGFLILSSQVRSGENDNIYPSEGVNNGKPTVPSYSFLAPSCWEGEEGWSL